MIHVSTILVNYNTTKDTLECLDSLENIKTTGFKNSIIIVDNASKEPFLLPERFSDSDIEVIRSESNKGFTGGNNMGIYYGVEKYSSDYVLLLNNDTTVDPNFLKEMVRMAQADANIGMVGSKIYFTKGREFHKESYSASELGNVLWYAGGSIDWNHIAASHRGVDEVDMGQFENQSESDFVTGCSMLVKREVLEKVGTFDKRFFLYFEDVDWSVRAQKAGYTIAFCPTSIVYHKNAGSSGGAGSSVHQYYQTRNRLLFAFKHGSELVVSAPADWIGTLCYEDAYCYQTGTSFSGPQVAAASAFIKAYLPDVTQVEVETILEKTAQGEQSIELGSGILDFEAIAQEILLTQKTYIPVMLK